MIKVRPGANSTHLPEGNLGPTRNPPLVLPDGRILMPSSRQQWGKWHVELEIYDTKTGQIESVAIQDQQDPLHRIIQPAVISRPDGMLLAFLRSNQQYRFPPDCTPVF